jgi:alpha-L-fucosidase
MWYRPTIRELPQSRYAFEAAGSVQLAPGEYTLRAISDDGIRVWLDGKLVIDNWDLHGSEIDYAPLTGGAHELKVQYFQIDGWAELRLDILRGMQRSPGSPGPH